MLNNDIEGQYFFIRHFLSGVSGIISAKFYVKEILRIPTHSVL